MGAAAAKDFLLIEIRAFCLGSMFSHPWHSTALLYKSFSSDSRVLPFSKQRSKQKFLTKLWFFSSESHCAGCDLGQWCLTQEGVG